MGMEIFLQPRMGTEISLEMKKRGRGRGENWPQSPSHPCWGLFFNARGAPKSRPIVIPGSDASRMIFLPIGTAKNHPTYHGKLTPQKKSYINYAVSWSSTTDVEETAHFIRSDEPVLPENDMTPNIKEMLQESARWDSSTPTKIARETWS